MLGKASPTTVSFLSLHVPGGQVEPLKVHLHLKERNKVLSSKLIMDHVSILHGLPFIPVELARFGPSFCFHVIFCDFLSSPSSEVNLADEDAWITAAKQPL